MVLLHAFLKVWVGQSDRLLSTGIDRFAVFKSGAVADQSLIERLAMG
jgi:hypothetical protein